MCEATDTGSDPRSAACLPDAPVENLAVSARTALAEAPEFCRAAPGRDACDWYHGFYPLLRLLGVAASPERHARFYGEALAPLVSGDARVLIPGAADAGMLRSVLAVRRTPGAHARIRVLDRCETPLRLCRGFAERWGTPIETERFDLLDTAAQADPEPCFDVACTHSLLAFFPPARRRAGIEACRARLRPGGKLVTTARIDPAASEAGTRFTGTAASAFAKRIRAAAAACDAAPELAPGAVHALALDYAERMVSWPFTSARQVALDFEASGFAIDRLRVVDVPGRLAAGAAGGGTHQPATYAEFVASRV